jgi:hypothetical protein
MKPAPYKILRSYGLDVRPHELNEILEIPGNDIFLYDTQYQDSTLIKNDVETTCLLYDYPIISIKKALKLLKIGLKRRLKIKI